MKQFIASNIVRAGLLLGAIHSCYGLEVDPVVPENPYVELRSVDGASVWIDRGDVAPFSALAQLLATRNGQPVQLQLSANTLTFIANAVILMKSLALRGIQLGVAYLPLFERATVNKPHFFDSPGSGIFYYVYQAVYPHVAQAATPAGLIELLDASAHYFPVSLLQVVVWAVMKKKDAPDLLQLHVSEHFNDKRWLVSYLHRCANPPKNSLVQRIILNGEPFKHMYDARRNTLILDLQAEEIDSLFGLGAVCRKFEFLNTHMLKKDPFYIINLSQNEIATIDSIDTLEFGSRESQFVHLSLRNNQLASIASSFLSNANNLQILDLSFNRLEQLPPRFLDACVDLETVRLDQNNLTTLPDDFLAQTDHLTVFTASYNKLLTLPDSFLSGATEIKTVDLAGNMSLQLPVTWLSGSHPRLKYVDLSALNLTQLPSTIFQQAPKLKQLDLRRNKLTQLPTALYALKNLETLYLEGNPIFYNESALAALPQTLKDAVENGRLYPDSDSEDDDQEDQQ